MASSECTAPMKIKLPSCVCILRRCDDAFFRRAWLRSVPIEPEYLSPSFSLLPRTTLGLPQLYATLTQLFGRSGKLYDDWKGAFAFPFKLTVERNSNQHKYLLKLTNYKAEVEHSILRVLQPGESLNRDVYYKPFDAELTRADMDSLVDYLYRSLEGYFQTMPRWDTPFLKHVRSNLIVFGYNKRLGDFFEEEYESFEPYEASLATWRAEIGPEPEEPLEWD
jgi:hypothetical protein